MPSSCLLMTVHSKPFSAFKKCACFITAVVNHSTCLELGGHGIICLPHYQCQSIAPFYLALVIVPVKTKPNKFIFLIVFLVIVVTFSFFPLIFSIGLLLP